MDTEIETRVYLIWSFLNCIDAELLQNQNYLSSLTKFDELSCLRGLGTCATGVFDTYVSKRSFVDLCQILLVFWSFLEAEFANYLIK